MLQDFLSYLAKNVVEVSDEDDNEGEAAKHVEKARNISSTGRTYQIPEGLHEVKPRIQST